jgi:hypothetical protein
MAPSRLLRKAVLVWLLVLALAVANGAFPEAVLLPSLGKPAALVLSGLLLAACIVAAAFLFLRWPHPLTTAAWLGLGLLWLALTLLFEFAFGRFVRGLSWQELLAAYQFRDGNLWPLVLVVTFLAPLLGARLRGTLSR